MWEDIQQAIAAATGDSFRIKSRQPVGGGCINEAVCLYGEHQRFFLKLNTAAGLAMFEAEAEGLSALAAVDAIRVPLPIAWGSTGECSWLVLEYMEFGAPGSETSALLGQQLAQLHRSLAPQFGWHRDNTIGTTPQRNRQESDWPTFFAHQRLGFQLRLAGDNGAGASLLDKGARLLAQLPALFDNHQPCPSLLHGDLWGGNWAADSTGQPVLFDPAVYFGDREADIAMTELFGGFDDRFYHAYRATWPLDAGYPVRRQLYKLYHVLNHFSLFGGSYQYQAENLLDSLLAEIA